MLPSDLCMMTTWKTSVVTFLVAWISAPFASSALMASSCPISAANINAVFPSCDDCAWERNRIAKDCSSHCILWFRALLEMWDLWNPNKWINYLWCTLSASHCFIWKKSSSNVCKICIKYLAAKRDASDLSIFIQTTDIRCASRCFGIEHVKKHFVYFWFHWLIFSETQPSIWRFFAIILLTFIRQVYI